MRFKLNKAYIYFYFLTKSVPRIVWESCSRAALQKEHASSLQSSCDPSGLHLLSGGSNESAVSPVVSKIPKEQNSYFDIQFDSIITLISYQAFHCTW